MSGKNSLDIALELIEKIANICDNINLCERAFGMRSAIQRIREDCADLLDDKNWPGQQQESGPVQGNLFGKGE